VALRLKLWSGPMFRAMQTAVVTSNGSGLQKFIAGTKFIYENKI
jgi:hypothetical protein